MKVTVKLKHSETKERKANFYSLKYNMIFKAFYQEDKTRSPRRETTKVLYLVLDVTDTREGVILARELLAANTDYHVEFIDSLSDEAVEYEKENGGLEITSF